LRKLCAAEGELHEKLRGRLNLEGEGGESEPALPLLLPMFKRRGFENDDVADVEEEEEEEDAEADRAGAMREGEPLLPLPLLLLLWLLLAGEGDGEGELRCAAAEESTCCW
jgi:hypothetical protein